MGADAERRVFDVIDPDKDVDGFHPVNVGHLVQNRATLAACTPSGVIELLERSNVADRRRPRRRHRPQRHRRQADGAAAAAPARDGDDLPFPHRRSAARRARRPTSSWRRSAAPAFVTREFVKPGAAVVDVGTTQVTDRALVERLFAAGLEAARRLRAARLDCGRRRASRGCRGRRRAVAGAGRRRPADHRDAAEEYARCGSGSRVGRVGRVGLVGQGGGG